MWDDDDDADWDDDDEFDVPNEHENIYKHPLMKKAKDVFRLTRALVGSLDEARKELYGNIMMEDAMIMSAKFAGAESISDYVLKMEKAVVIKVHAKSLQTMTYQLGIEETHAEEHLELLRESIEEYRLLFIEWTKCFDSEEKNDDGWGIFTD
ncbi:hypothetical protein LV84_02752 [Algoriphagus ratkowskyi]|uniref:Four helix bundle protein n=1 Tax=Algoriphagus ratkowskyi TaxID=57028 RepID=A0A2W7RJD9_9BACT|nr:hypothetical protein [Algoriphagus ratkowskyi]PZX54599.1 hypothetical protein LV84_02752 [Algoriphagus ratkowskyi]TXD76914.1 hypothetical protein ESW18_13980 [Algoriphagus ratkowskyi]